MWTSHDVVVAVPVRCVLGTLDRATTLVIRHGVPFSIPSLRQPITPLCQFGPPPGRGENAPRQALTGDRASVWQHVSAHPGNLLNQSLEGTDRGISGQAFPTEAARRCAVNAGLLGIT